LFLNRLLGDASLGPHGLEGQVGILQTANCVLDSWVKIR